MWRSAEAPGFPLAWFWQALCVPWLHVSLQRYLWGHVPEPPLLPRSTCGSGRQLSSSRKLKRSGNERNKRQHLGDFFVCLFSWKIFVRDDACYYQLHFSEIDLCSPGDNEVRKLSQLSPVKPQIFLSLTQVEGKLSPDLEMIIHLEFAMALWWSMVTLRGRNEF